MSIDERLEEAVLAYLFGDDDDEDAQDPGLLVADAAATPGFVVWLDGLAADLPLLARAAGGDPATSRARLRLDALRNEVRSYVAPGGVHDAASANGDGVVSLVARRRDMRRTYAFVATLAAVAAGILVAVMTLGGGPGAPEAPRPTVAQAKAWVEALDAGGLGFSGDARSAHDRGFMLGVVRDLSQAEASGAPASAEALEVARLVASQAAAGLGLGERPEALRVKALAGCRGWVPEGEVPACEQGLLDYVRHRDAELAPKR